MDNIKTWKRGRKKATLEQQAEAHQKQKDRQKIANLVARKQVDKKCRVCGEDGQILHNAENPYYITFICKECRKDPEKLKKAEEIRFDIREILDKKYLCTGNFTEEDVKTIVEGYIKSNNILSIGNYCDSVGISRHQFNQLIDRYALLYPEDKLVANMIVERSKKLHRAQLSKIVQDKQVYENV